MPNGTMSDGIAGRVIGAAWDLAKAQRVALAVAGAGMVAAGWLYRAGVAHERERAAAQVARTRVAAVVETLRVVEIQYRTDTLRLTRWRTRWDTLITERHYHDTVWVERVIAVADSTIRACTQALGTCERRVALEQQRAALFQAQLTDMARRIRQTKRRRVIELVGAASAGLVLGRAIR
jgi:hypothetical protein